MKLERLVHRLSEKKELIAIGVQIKTDNLDEDVDALHRSITMSLEDYESNHKGKDGETTTYRLSSIDNGRSIKITSILDSEYNWRVLKGIMERPEFRFTSKYDQYMALGFQLGKFSHRGVEVYNAMKRYIATLTEQCREFIKVRDEERARSTLEIIRQTRNVNYQWAS